MKYVKGLDTLRAFAVIFVLLGHWGLPVTLGSVGENIFKGLIPNAAFGVNLFFVLSGFLITTILLNAANSEESRFVTLRNFIVRRTLRIFPIYYLAIFTLAIIGDPFIRQYLWWFLTYTS